MSLGDGDIFDYDKKNIEINLKRFGHQVLQHSNVAKNNAISKSPPLDAIDIEKTKNLPTTLS